MVPFDVRTESPVSLARPVVQLDVRPRGGRQAADCFFFPIFTCFFFSLSVSDPAAGGGDVSFASSFPPRRGSLYRLQLALAPV